jgi:hypothetical protein
MRKLHEYNVHDLVRVRSERRLPELEYFRADALHGAIDIEVTVSANPARSSSPGALRYRELLGRWGFEIGLDRAPERTLARVSPLIAASPHVLYTNVVEPLLRWILVRKGYALMHGACLAMDGSAVFVTARTDTGKTTTILNTLRGSTGDYAFLSDDMTIFCPDGRVLAFPKPLTISRHTVRAIGMTSLTGLERLKLVPQSRLHSKGGRGVGMELHRRGFPAATLSAIVQRLIPPPKFMVDRLVPGARYADTAWLDRVVVIERGPDGREELPADRLADLLVANAEDAYGFPPYPVLEHELCRWRGEDLHGRERATVASALAGKPAVRMRSSSFAWHEYLLSLAVEAGNGGVGEAPGRALRDRSRSASPRLVPDVPAFDG